MPMAWLALLWVDISKRLGDEFDPLLEISLLAGYRLRPDVRSLQDQAIYGRRGVDA
jgi:hypothetical protein